MSLITLLNAQIAFGERPLLDEAQLTIRAGERLGLIGRNGTGKSTLLGVLAGKTRLDDGELQRREGLRLGLVEQEPQLPPAETLQDSLLLRATAYAAWSEGAPADEREHWRLESRLEEFLYRFGLTGVISPASCSGGERKRAVLALALALQPDLLLLDEPTNHLDIEAIERLEELLLKVPASMVITHDRAFLDRITTRIIELDRGVLRSYPGNFAAYEQRKDQELAAEDTARRRFDKFWQQEEAWIRKRVDGRGTRLSIAYFDQLRAQLDPTATLAEAISPGSDWVQLGSERKHIASYLGEFLFPAQRAKSPISMLSGGERNRLLLARLFAQPANLVILDEPTNDLDIESLELLEERLQDYQGTLLLVSHDRRFLDNVVTQTLAAEGNGVWREYAGGYSDYLQQRPPMPVARANEAGKTPARRGSRDRSAGETPAKTRTRLSYKEERELAALPEEIESLEREQTELTARMSEPDYHRLEGARLRGDRKRLAELEELLLEKFARWESLEEQRARPT